MFTVSESILVNADMSYIFQKVSDVRTLPDIFPPYQQVEILASDKQRILFRITALMKRGRFSIKGKPFSWESEWFIRKKEGIIEINELGPKQPLKYLKASYKFTPRDSLTEISLQHNFDLTIKVPIIRNILGAMIKLFIIGPNSRSEVRAIKLYTEGKII